jgi:ubiquinone/menaquinone biosynthesis C-methylase UbiE
MIDRDGEGQSEESVSKNAQWFDRNAGYVQNVSELDTYRRLREETDRRLNDPGLLLDIGNGGVFDYDVTKARKLTALDLFLDADTAPVQAPNIEYVRGSALDLPFGDASFDTVFMSMLLHHLTGGTVAETRLNVRKAIAECARVAKPDGRVVIVESCVPAWFYAFERIAYRPACATVGRLIEHPMTLQHTARSLTDMLNSHFSRVVDDPIPKGRWVLQFGYRVPSVLTPVEVHIFSADGKR